MSFSEYWKKHQRSLWGIVVLLVLLAGWGVYAAFSAASEPKSENPEDLIRFVASSGFRRLPEEQQRYYLEKLRPARGERRDHREMRASMEKLSESERRAFFDNMRRVREAERAKEALAYVKMSQAEKNEFLDRKIAEFDRRHAEMEKLRAQREKEKAQQQNGTGNQEPQQNQERPNFAAMRKIHMESTAPEVRAARDTMMRDMMARRKATGKSMPAPPHGEPPR